MKRVVILPDGAADEPLAALGGRSPLTAAETPNADWIARQGVTGRVVTTSGGFAPGTDVATMTLLGYEPSRYYTGRAPIEAAARQIPVGDGEVVFRCNFVTVADDRLQDFTADHIDQPEADALIELLNANLAAEHRCRFYTGVSYRNLMVLHDAAGATFETTPPHNIPGEPLVDHAPRGSGADRVAAVQRAAAALIAEHVINVERGAAGRPPVTDIWLWGEGRPSAFPSFAERFGCRGPVITAVDIIRGLATLVDLPLLNVPTATGYLDTDYAAKGAAAVKALRDHDLVVVHIEAPDEAGHLGDGVAKAESLARIDADITGPILDYLRGSSADWRILIAPDHYTPCTTRVHNDAPPPFCYAGAGVKPNGAGAFDEAAAAGTGLMVDPGWELMERFITR